MAPQSRVTCRYSTVPQKGTASLHASLFEEQNSFPEAPQMNAHHVFGARTGTRARFQNNPWQQPWYHCGRLQSLMICQRDTQEIDTWITWLHQQREKGEQQLRTGHQQHWCWCPSKARPDSGRSQPAVIFPRKFHKPGKYFDKFQRKNYTKIWLVNEWHIWVLRALILFLFSYPQDPFYQHSVVLWLFS